MPTQNMTSPKHCKWLVFQTIFCDVNSDCAVSKPKPSDHYIAMATEVRYHQVFRSQFNTVVTHEPRPPTVQKELRDDSKLLPNKTG